MDELKIDTPEQIALELPLAGIGSRFLALGIDTLLQSILYIVGAFVFIFAIPFASGLFTFKSWSWGPAIGVLFLFCVYWGYFAFFEIIWKGQTPGKRYAGIRVIKETGRPIDSFEAIGRNLLRAVDALPGIYGVGVVCMMLNKQNRRLGDFVAGTVVVHEKLTDEVRPGWNATDSTASVTPQIASVTAEELVLIETYLHRRWDLDPVVRFSTSNRIAERIKAKTGLERKQGETIDDYLESVARQIRDSGRFA
jgi:uncharacterized RDD family membrane protein YckC